MFAALREEWSGKWPLPRAGIPPDQRSTVSLLFSGGVFRGVFQVGVLNAISEASLRPDVVAGASVGSITSAMAARAFVTPGLDGATALNARRAFIRRLAAAYLAIDRLILTDRFADFVRGFTIRAAQARFSVRDADRVLRRFDAANPWTFSREVRRVLAGFERLAYVSPFELREVVEAFRREQVGTGTGLLEDYFQELLDRAGVGQEVLGAEPLERLINDFVLEGLAPPGVRSAHVTFQELLDRGIFFFATATNLTDGRLHAWGDDQLLSVGQTPLNLLQALLASSAFPGVFRRRWSWEVLPGTPHPHEYADGGVMDNLPLDAVAHFLDSAAEIGLIARRPGVPHLLLSASLETAPRPVTDPDVLAGLCGNWPRLRSRTGELAYNRKVELFERTQENLRWMMEARDKGVDPNKVWTPLDLEVLTIVPRWLCGTMAFHPMLGFRRSNEAESIAHGCAATLLALGKRLRETTDGPTKITAWAVEDDGLPSADQCLARDPFIPLVPLKKEQTGNCWFRPRVPCPFSYGGQGKSEKGSNSRTAYELHEIYLACKKKNTHRPR
jgi:predicted acylesterase/phospholipase RssA